AVTERPVGGDVPRALGEGLDQHLAADAVGRRDAAEKDAFALRGHGSYAAGFSAAAAAAAASRSRRFLRGLALVGLLRASRLARPAASRKRSTRSVGWAPTDSQCLARSTLSLTRSAWSLGSSGLWVPICSM